jgi:hypothetical protein
MISSHCSHIATRHGAYLFFLKNSFVNFKFSSSAVVIFACELIPAVAILFRTFPAKVAGKLEKILPPRKCRELFQAPFA